LGMRASPRGEQQQLLVAVERRHCQAGVAMLGAASL
jgi:hypothetical protein